MKNDPEQRYQILLAHLKQRGSRITSHRLALLRLLAVSEGHPNAAQLYERLKVSFPTVSLATVYKTLALLKDAGEVLEIDLHSDSHYDGNNPHPHPHLVCTRCGKIADGDDLPALHTVLQQASGRYGFTVERQQVVFYGLCASCSQPQG